LEFSPNAGFWTIAAFKDDAARETWEGPVKGALRLLGDSGFGGERSRGWGRAEIELPDYTAGPISVPEIGGETAWWLLSLFHPAADDTIDWTRGNYSVTTRSGRVESDAGWGEPKRNTRMIAEGSVLVASSEPRGSAVDVAPNGFAHPVYRSGYALALPIPLKVEPFRVAA
jgi:CRISPR type III-A-associated RAMP protein Csm4